MKIGYFSSKFPYSNNVPNYKCGGSILATQSLVNEISKMGHEIKVFTTSNTSNDQYENHGNLEIYRYGTEFKLLSSNLSLGLFYKTMDHDVDLVHVSFDIPPGPFAGYRYAKKKKLPLIVTYHGDWEENYGNFIRRRGVSITNGFVDKIMSYADIIISPSELYAKSSKYLRNYPEKIVFIPNGINLNEFKTNLSKEECRNKLNLPLNKKIILFFGYLSPYKSPDILIKALCNVLEEFPNTILLFAGNGELMDDLQDLSKKLGVHENVIFAGFIRKDLRVLYYRSSDIFCLPSTMSTECYPLAILEAMACKVPVVASEIGGIPDIIENGINGVLIPPNNLKYLEDTILRLFKNSNLRKKISNNAFKKIQSHSWDSIAIETLKKYKSLESEESQ